jgi:hypothetical protein
METTTRTSFSPTPSSFKLAGPSSQPSLAIQASIFDPGKAEIATSPSFYQKDVKVIQGSERPLKFTFLDDHLLGQKTSSTLSGSSEEERPQKNLTSSTQRMLNLIEEKGTLSLRASGMTPRTQAFLLKIGKRTLLSIYHLSPPYQVPKMTL